MRSLAGLRNEVLTLARGVLLVATAMLASHSQAAAADLIWGANGHPIVSYPDISLERQLDLLRELGMSSYRIDIRNETEAPKLSRLVRAARVRGLEILPVITPDVDLDKTAPEALFARSYEIAHTLVSQFKGQIGVWELGNELENYAIIRSCETRENGVQYSCGWGAPDGRDPLDYYGPRWAKASAVLKGLSEGAIAADPSVRKAMGTAGWGHTGAFERMQRDGIRWDISVWHMYGEDPERAFKEIARYGRPIWVTELNHHRGSQFGEEAQARGLRKQMQRLRELRATYKVEAAHIYELLDEPYWAPDWEAVMGLVTVEKNARGRWAIGRPKAAYQAVRELIGATQDIRPAPVPTLQPAAFQPLQRGCTLGEFSPLEHSTSKQIAYGYCLVLARPVDGAGTQDYEQASSRRDWSISDLLSELVASEEFVRTHRTEWLDDKEYVELLYRLLLGRPVDADALAKYVDALQEAELDRGEVAMSIIASDEFRSRHPVLSPRPDRG